MPTINHTLVRKTPEGSDKHYIETGSNLVVRPNGKTAEETLDRVEQKTATIEISLINRLTETRAVDTKPIDAPNKVVIGPTKRFIGNSEMSLAGHTHAFADITPKPTAADIGAASVTSINNCWVLLSSFTNPGAFSWTVPNKFSGKDYYVGVLIIGGGGSGGAASESWNYFTSSASGGASGYSLSAIKLVSPNAVFSGTIGSGGGSASARGAGTNGNPGSPTTFMNMTAKGGGGGYGAIWPNNTNPIGVMGAAGGQCSSGSKYPSDNLFGGLIPCLQSGLDSSEPGLCGNSTSCFNPFEFKSMLGAGGGSYAGGYGGKSPYDGTGGGNANVTNSTATGEAANSPGCGGGAAKTSGWAGSDPYTATSGAGAPGAVYIYAMGL